MRGPRPEDPQVDIRPDTEMDLQVQEIVGDTALHTEIVSAMSMKGGVLIGVVDMKEGDRGLGVEAGVGLYL